MFETLLQMLFLHQMYLIDKNNFIFILINFKYKKKKKCKVNYDEVRKEIKGILN